ncbi:MAG: CBU_0592 family membrane protein [Acetobacteraceae bacterium]
MKRWLIIASRPQGLRNDRLRKPSPSLLGGGEGWVSERRGGFFLGSILILASLTTAWNLPSAVIEAFWAAISLYGLARRGWLKRRDWRP